MRKSIPFLIQTAVMALVVVLAIATFPLDGLAQRPAQQMPHGRHALTMITTTPSATASMTPTATITATPTITATATITPTVTATVTVTATNPSVYAPVIILSAATATPTATPTSASGWLGYLNRFRDEANLPHLGENPDWSYGDWLHGRYMVKNDYVGHNEDPGNPWYTIEGQLAAQGGNVVVSSWSGAPDTFAIDFFMAAPFHGIAILDPELHTTGFGSYRESIGLWKMGATLDVTRGRGTLAPGIQFPILFPGDGGQTWLLRYPGGEWPNPLASCPGYSAPSGPPIMLQIGTGDQTPLVMASDFSQGGISLEHCIFDETTYSNSDAAQQNSGRVILGIRDAIVLMPRQPLQSGLEYRATILVNGVTYSWQFTAVTQPFAYPVPPGTMMIGR